MMYYEDNLRKIMAEHNTIILFGASRGARYSIEVIQKLGYKIDCIIENRDRLSSEMYADKFSESVLDIPVYDVVTGLNLYQNPLVLITLMDMVNIDEAYKMLQQHNVQYRYIMPEIIYLYSKMLTNRNLDFNIFNKYKYELFNKNARLINNNIAPSATVVITERCNLNCQDCAAFVPFNLNPNTSSAETIIRSVKNYCSSFEIVYRICIMGGETFLHKDINRIISEISLIPNLIFIDIATNGTVIPPEGTLDIVKMNGVCLEISDYGLHSRKMNQLNKICDKKGVLRYHQKFNYWGSLGDVKDYHRDASELNQHFIKCITFPATTNHIIDGLLYRCLYSGMTSRLNMAPINQNDFVDLNVELTSSSLINAISTKVKNLSYKTTPLETCKYCKMGEKVTKAGVQLPLLKKEKI